MDTQQTLPSNLEQLQDQISLLKMDWLTSLGRTILPPGYWGEASDKTVETINDDADSANKKILYLTFDDGPNPHTTQALLELLYRENVPATFFFIGAHVDRHADIAASPLLKNHTIGSHSYSHIYLPLLSAKAFESEIVRTNEAIQKACGVKPRVFRPPYGVIDKRAADCLTQHNLKLVYWGAVPEDWQAIGSQRIVERVAQRLAPGKMIVLHEGKRIAEQTLVATKQIIDRARAEGFAFKAL